MNLRVLWPLGLAGSIASAATQRLGPHQFTLAEGFNIQLAAGTNLVHRPVSGSFDADGRLYVTDASGDTSAPEEQLRNPQWRVLRLEDTDHDGTFDKVVVFADKLPFLQGILWHKGDVYVGGTPSITKLTDTDGDGVSDRRVEWWNVGRKPTHCGNEVHGPYAGPDGYLYWTKGAFEPITWTNSTNGKVEHDRAAHIFRARPDGTGMESVMTGGMDNPVEVAFNSSGECFFTTTFVDFTQPGFRDGVCHAVYGGVFGKVNSALDDHAVVRAPDLMQPISELGAAAPSGLCRYDGTAFGAGYRDNLFASLFNLHKITRHVLRPEGGTYHSDTSDFVSSDSLDFHPTDVLTAPDGSVVILDTGGWYKLCCPSSQLAKADVLGSVYRVKRDAAVALATPAREERLPAWKLASLRHEKLVAPADLEVLLHKANPTPEEVGQMRLAAEVIGRSGTPGATRLLLELAAKAPSRATEATALRALIDTADAAGLRAALQGRDPKERRAALIALDQIPDEALRPSEAAPFFVATEAPLREAAVWVVSRHDQWGDELAGFLRDRLQPGQPTSVDRTVLFDAMRSLVSSPGIKQLIADLVAGPKVELGDKVKALRIIGSLGQKEYPQNWHVAVEQSLKASLAAPDNEDTAAWRSAAVSAARELVKSEKGGSPVAEALLDAARRPALPKSLRIAAYAAAPANWDAGAADVALLTSAIGSPSGTEAADALSRAAAGSGELMTLVGYIKPAGPIELPRLLGAFDSGGSEALGTALLAAMRESKSKASVQPDALRKHLSKFPAPVQSEGEKWLAEIQVGGAEKRAHLEALAKSLPAGDVRRGQLVFNSAKAQCIACHQLGYQGGDVGPDLTSIGQARSERDLLESIVFPSASFVRSYEPLVVETKGGDAFSGIVKQDDNSGILLVTGPNLKQKIARGDIAATRPGDISVMPAGFEEVLTRQELSDLIVFLKNTRWGAN